jgi:hypothetical protein
LGGVGTTHLCPPHDDGIVGGVNAASPPSIDERDSVRRWNTVAWRRRQRSWRSQHQWTMAMIDGGAR